jgi:hypothetical protein
MEPILPTWFKYRQGKAEAAGTHSYRLTAPNLADAFLSIRATQNDRWQGVVRLTADGPDLGVSAPGLGNPGEAWEAAFELYRQHIVFGPPVEQVSSEAP